MNYILKAFVICLFVATLFFTSLKIMIVQHELAHKEIFDKFDINSEIEYSFLTGVTYPNVKEYKENCNDSCLLAQSNVEAFGYQLMGFYISLWILFAVYMIFKGWVMPK